MNKLIIYAAVTCLFFCPARLFAQNEALRQQIQEIIKPAKGIVGVALLNIESNDTLNINGNARLVMQSVMKFPIALNVLHLVDTGKLSLSQIVHFTRRDLSKTNTTMRQKYPDGKGDISIRELLSLMISESDNDACDILLKRIGGPNIVQAYMLRLGLRGITVRTTEADMAMAWEMQYLNWCKPKEMAVLLEQFYQGKILAKNTTDLLLKMMTGSTTGPNRIKGLLPAGTVVAHKTGSSATDAQGLTPATNDVGIITLPNGKHLVLTVFVCNSTADEQTRDGIIAKIGKAAYGSFGAR